MNIEYKKKTNENRRETISHKPWISCSERLPNVLEPVLVCYDISEAEGEFIEGYDVAYMRPDEIWISERGLEEIGISDVTILQYSTEQIIGWMPIPRLHQ